MINSRRRRETEIKTGSARRRRQILLPYLSLGRKPDGTRQNFLFLLDIQYSTVSVEDFFFVLFVCTLELGRSAGRAQFHQQTEGALSHRK